MNTLRLFLLSPLGVLGLRWTLLLALAWTAHAVMRRSHPRWRLILWRGVLVLGCLLPWVGVVPLKIFRIDGAAALTRGWAATDSSAPSALGRRPTPTVRAALAVPLESSPIFRRAVGFLAAKSATTWVALVWMIGGAAGAMRLLLLQFRLSRLRRKTREPEAKLLALARDVQARLGLRQIVTVRVSDEVTSPFICGLLRPTIIVPAELLRALAPEQIPALLSHEMAHLRSHDLAWSVGWRWMKALGWFHPLVWKIPVAHNLACEQEADRIASDQWADRSLYTRWLAQLTLRVMEVPAVETTWALNGGSQIVQRLVLLRRDRFRRWKWRDSLAGFGLVAGLALAAAGWGFSTARAENPPAEFAQRLAEQQRPRTVVPFDPQQFDKYVGFYQMGPNGFFTVTRKDDHFYCRLTGQHDVEFYPESPTKFFATVVAAQISFVTDGAGHVTGLILHQAGMEQPAHKVEESALKIAASALAQRIKSNTPAPDREAPLRRFIAALIQGQPNFDDMAPGLTAATHQQWPRIEKEFQGAGALKSLVFKRVKPDGMDVYVGTFENQEIAFLIGPLTPDHKMQGLLMLPTY